MIIYDKLNILIISMYGAFNRVDTTNLRYTRKYDFYTLYPMLTIKILY